MTETQQIETIKKQERINLYGIWKELCAEHPHRFRIVWNRSHGECWPEFHTKGYDGFTMIMKLPPWR